MKFFRECRVAWNRKDAPLRIPRCGLDLPPIRPACLLSAAIASFGPWVMSGASADMDVDSAAPIDEALYSRQLYVLGHEAMRRMAGVRLVLLGRSR